MDDKEILLQEYNNLWNEKIIHKQSIRKFHYYLSYLTAITSLALAFYGISPKDVLVGSSTVAQAADKVVSVVHLLFIPFTPIVLLTLTFPMNDVFHEFAIGHHIGNLEKRINALCNGNDVLRWEHSACPVIYGGEKVGDEKIKNLITAGDSMILFPALIALCLTTTILGARYLYSVGGWVWVLPYIVIVLYMFITMVCLGLTLAGYIKPKGLLSRAIRAINFPRQQASLDVKQNETTANSNS